MEFNENLFFEISNQGNSIKIETLYLIKYDSEIDYDRNWIQCKVIVSGGAFSGEYISDLMTTDFEKFKHELNSLYTNLNSVAEFYDLESAVNIKIKGDGIGHFNAEIICNDSPGIETAQLKYEIDFDQTFIKGIVKQLNDITRKFPIKGDFNIQNNYNI